MASWNENVESRPGSSRHSPPMQYESQQASQTRLKQTQAQVDEVVDIMKSNVAKVMERDTKLSELDDRAEALNQGASQFERSAGKLKRKYCWQNIKMMIILGIVVAVLLIIIIVWITSSVGGGGDDDDKNKVTNALTQ